MPQLMTEHITRESGKHEKHIRDYLYVHFSYLFDVWEVVWELGASKPFCLKKQPASF